MKIVVDAMCAEYGGIRTLVEHLLSRWADDYPQDEVHVVLRAGSSLATPGLTRHEIAVGRPDSLGRPWAQARGMHRLVRRVRPDVVLATAPTTNPRRMPAPLAVMILDLRAEIRPQEFSRGRRLLRHVSYNRTYQLAAGFVSISHRSLSDLHRLHPKTRKVPGTVAHLGADHVLSWPTPDRSGPAIAFAHHSNKNPRLVLQGWAELVSRGTRERLLLVGVPAAARQSLGALIDDLSLGGLVELTDFLDTTSFQRAFAESRAVVFPSSFEGFGLPIVEGMLLGKPVVIGADPGCEEVAGGHATVLSAWEAPQLADAVESALTMSDTQLAAARSWAEGFTWCRTLDSTRRALASLSGFSGDG